jgi:MFS transporter, DHA1 family, tetracycline resistance protein
MISLCGSVIGYLLFGFANSIVMLLLSRAIAGIAAANIGTAQAYIADVTTEENRAKGMGLIGAAFGVGFIFGPLLGGSFSALGIKLGLHGNLLPGLVAAGLSLVALSVAIFALPESRPPDLVPRGAIPPHFDPKTWRTVLANQPLVLAFGSLFLVILTFSGMEPLVTLHGANFFHFKPQDLGKIFGFMGVVVALVQGGVIGRMTRAFGEARTAMIGGMCLATGLAIVPQIGRVPFLYAAALLIALGQGFCYPSLTATVTKVVPKANVGSMLGISSALGSLARVLGPMFGGSLYDHLHVWAFWGEAAVASFVIVLTMLLASAVFRRQSLQENGVSE